MNNSRINFVRRVAKGPSLNPDYLKYHQNIIDKIEPTYEQLIESEEGSIFETQEGLRRVLEVNQRLYASSFILYLANKGEEQRKTQWDRMEGLKEDAMHLSNLQTKLKLGEE